MRNDASAKCVLCTALMLWAAGQHGATTSADAFSPGDVRRGYPPLVVKKKMGNGVFGAKTISSSSSRCCTRLKSTKTESYSNQFSTPASSSGIMGAYEATSRGVELQARGALNAAVAAFKEAVELHPTAERQFRLALAYEENGEPLLASESYEAAAKNWDGTTDVVLRHDANLKLAHVWGHDLGNVPRGLGYLEEALAMEDFDHTIISDVTTWDQKAYFVADEGRLEEAIKLWDGAIKGAEDYLARATGGNHIDEETTERLVEMARDGRFFRAVAQRLLNGLDVESHGTAIETELAALPPDCHYMIESWNYAKSHYPKEHLWQRPQGRFFAGTHAMLTEALGLARPDGIVCEFGVFHGKSIRLLGSMVGPENPVDGFDTFEGIPEAWGDEPAGTYTAAAEIPQRVPPNVRFHVGLFADTLPGYVASLPPELPARFINVDCDLYQGTVEILHYLADRIGPGTVIIFDEYFMCPTWREDEYKAFQEAVEKFGWEYDYLGFSLSSKQVAVKITASKSFVGPPAAAAAARSYIQ